MKPCEKCPLWEERVTTLTTRNAVLEGELATVQAANRQMFQELQQLKEKSDG